MDFSTPAKHMPSNPKKPLTLKEALSSVADFRIDRRKKYPLYEILMITVCAMIDGARGPTDFWRFGRGKIGFLRKFLPLVNGIPSHDTFRRVLGKLDTKRFNALKIRSHPRQRGEGIFNALAVPRRPRFLMQRIRSGNNTH